MGKYMRKAKNSKGEIAVIEVTHHKESTTTTTTTTLGVRTRAKTLALQQKSGVVVDGGGGGGSYLQLRSRRVILEGGKRLKHPLKPVVKKNENCSRMRGEGHSCNSVEMEEEEGGVEASFGENLLEFEPRERTTRESTPCSLIRDPDNIQTPGSSTKPTNASGANSREPDSSRKHIPAAHEMNDFFAGPEEQQQKQFIDKYNFDPVNEKPLPGRYEWVKVDP